MTRAALTLGTLVLIAGCAAQTTQRSKVDRGQKMVMRVASDTPGQPGKKMICAWEEPTGSHIPEKVCRLEEDVDFIREETQDYLRTHAAQQRIIKEN